MRPNRKTSFPFQPARFIPFCDLQAITRVRGIKRTDIAKHPNPDFRITVVADTNIESLWIGDMFRRIKAAMEAGERYVMIMPNPWPGYVKLVALLNRARVDCRKLHTFNMDEYAGERGRIAPESWEFGFGHAFKKYFWSQLNPRLRPPEKHVHVFTKRNVASSGRMRADLGGADICYSGPGCTGRLAFIEPDAKEFAGSLAAWKKMGAAHLHAEPVHDRAELAARLFWHERRPVRGAAESRNHRPGRSDRGQAPHRHARDHGRRILRLLATADFAPRAARPGHASRPRIHPANAAHRRVGFRIHRRGHQDPLGQRLLILMPANSDTVLSPVEPAFATVPRVRDMSPAEAIRAKDWPPMPVAVFLLQQSWRHMPEPAYRQGLVWLAATDTALLVCAQLSDDYICTSATKDHEYLWELGDAFEIFLHQVGTTPYSEIEIAPNGKSLELCYPQLDSPRHDGIEPYIVRGCLLDSAVAIDHTNRQWCVALKLPLASLPGVDLGQPSEAWRIAFCRYDYAADGTFCLTSSAPLTKANFNRIHEWPGIHVPGGFVCPQTQPTIVHFHS